jgi:hypothetical protein
MESQSASQKKPLQDVIKRMLASGLGYVRDVFSNLIKP